MFTDLIHLLHFYWVSFFSVCVLFITCFSVPNLINMRQLFCWFFIQSCFVICRSLGDSLENVLLVSCQTVSLHFSPTQLSTHSLPHTGTCLVNVAVNSQCCWPFTCLDALKVWLADLETNNISIHRDTHVCTHNDSLFSVKCIAKLIYVQKEFAHILMQWSYKFNTTTCHYLLGKLQRTNSLQTRQKM